MTSSIFGQDSSGAHTGFFRTHSSGLRTGTVIVSPISKVWEVIALSSPAKCPASNQWAGYKAVHSALKTACLILFDTLKCLTARYPFHVAFLKTLLWSKPSGLFVKPTFRSGKWLSVPDSAENSIVGFNSSNFVATSSMSLFCLVVETGTSTSSYSPSNFSVRNGLNGGLAVTLFFSLIINTDKSVGLSIELSVEMCSMSTNEQT